MRLHFSSPLTYRKAKDSDPGKATSKSPKVKTPRAKGKKSTPAAVASTPCEVTPKPGPNPGQHASEHSRPRSEQSPSTSLCPAEVRMTEVDREPS